MFSSKQILNTCAAHPSISCDCKAFMSVVMVRRIDSVLVRLFKVLTRKILEQTGQTKKDTIIFLLR